MIEDEEYVICPSSMPNDIKYKQYPWRWYVLAVTCLLALTNAAIWISFSAVGAHVNVFYCDDSYFVNKENVTKFPTNEFLFNSKNVPCDIAYWNNQIFQIVGCIGGIFGIFVTDKYGIRVSTYCASILNFIGIILRTMSAIPALNHSWRLSLLYMGQTLAASAQPFFIVLSPKVAENWFSDNQRAFANALSFAANPAGVVLGSVVPELIFHENFSIRNDYGLLWLNTLLLGFGATVMILTFGMQTSLPPTPPSASSATDHYPPFFQGLFALFKIPTFYIQIIVFALAFGLQWSLFISIEPMLTQLGYEYIGFSSALSAIAGCASSLIAGCYVDKTKNFSQVIKGSSIGVAIVACCINGFIRHHQGSVWDYLIMGFLLMLLGFFSIPAFPIGLELGIETTFPIAEASSSGVLIIFSQLMLFLLSAIINYSPQLDFFYFTQISSGGKDNKFLLTENFQLSMDIWTGIAVIFMLFTCFALWPKYKRLEFERRTTLHSKESTEEV
uniref:Major facilitator superfamily (MFS) profile domain-containing protein n=1 Tax=Panagrolaimus sp. PS1159 TaxID=55785 RepID=A0AC35FU51_9BILA